MLLTFEAMKNRLGAGDDIPANHQVAEAAGTSIEAIRRFMDARGILGMIDTISDSGRRITDIVENMLSFSRKSEGKVSKYSLDKIIEETLTLAATDYDLKKEYDFREIKIEKEYDKKLPPLPCEKQKIQQVLLNIFGNGAYAMQTAGVEHPRFRVRTWLDKERHMACLAIADNGPGMNENTRRRVFEPFFTTKPVGVGTGLGLSVSYFSVTQNHHGEMMVESQPGAGAEFIIRLPLEGNTK
jgi:signal transduction histidine kinase